MYAGIACALFLAQQPNLTPAQLELIEICKADQADRMAANPSEINWSEVSKRDENRRLRVKDFIRRDELITGDDFDRAALIFQHGSKPIDFVIAHELYLMASQLKKYGNGPAISEDRHLNSINQRQRFGTQFNWDSKLKFIDETKPFGVTDALRLDSFCPPLWLAKKDGPGSPVAFELIFARIKKVADKDWQLQKNKSKESKELKALYLTNDSAKSRKRVIEVYLEDKLGTKEDFYHAAFVLCGSTVPSELLLAHELSCVAIVRGHPNAFWLACYSWDLWKMAMKEKPRYGTTGHPPQSDLYSTVFQTIQRTKPKIVPR